MTADERRAGRHSKPAKRTSIVVTASGWVCAAALAVPLGFVACEPGADETRPVSRPAGGQARTSVGPVPGATRYEPPPGSSLDVDVDGSAGTAR